MGEPIMAFMIDEGSPHNVGRPAYEEAGKKSKYKWLKSEDNVYAMVQNSETVDSIEPGMYTLFADNRGALHAELSEMDTDELYILPNNHINEVIDETEDFWKKARKFKDAKIKHKRGIMLEGPGGTGKTSIMNILAKKLVDKGGIVITVRNTNELMWYIDWMHSNLRVAHPDLPVIVLLEDIDKYMDGGGVESTLLNWLDGEDSVDHQVVIATTNYYDSLNSLLLRPSRFDHHITVDKPSPLIKEAYLINKGLDAVAAKSWSEDTDDFSLAELKELYSSVKLLDLDYEKAKGKINKQAAAVVNKVGTRSKKKSEEFGFFGISKKNKD